MDELKPLTPEQIKNWRKTLCTMFGPYALIMPEDQINAIRNKMQSDCKKMIESEPKVVAVPKPEPKPKQEPKVDASMANIWKRKLEQR
jgi:hypothetical protein